MVFALKGRQLIVGDDQGNVTIWAVDAKEATRLGTGAAASAVDFSKIGGWLAFGNADGIVRVVETENWNEVGRFTHQEQVNSLAFSADGRWLAVIGESIAVAPDTTAWLPQVRIEHEEKI